MQNRQVFEAPYTNQEYYSQPEADAMLGWAKNKWEQWRKGKVEIKKDMTREQMARFLQDKWNRNPILRRLANAQRLRGQTLHRELLNILRDFERTTGITMQAVPEGTVQRLRNQPGNFSSLRSRPGFLQIEQQVFQNTDQLLKEVRHELAYHYAGGPGKVPTLKNTPFNALQLLEFMIQGNGKLPPPVAPLSSQREAEDWMETKTSTNPWPRKLVQARQMLNNARRHLAANNLKGFEAALSSAVIYINQAEAGIRSRISGSPRLAGITVETASARNAIQIARNNRTNSAKADSQLEKAIRHLLSARAAVGLKLV
jgi:hypothetical protein